MSGKSKHPFEFREKVAQEAIETGKIKAVAARYELDPTLVYGWVRTLRNKAAIQSKKSIRQYQKELEEVQLEVQVLRELLKKTTNALIKE